MKLKKILNYISWFVFSKICIGFAQRSAATRSGEIRNELFSVKDKNSCETQT